jgi:hypothetical protein
MIYRITRKNVKKLQLFGAGLGTLIGLVLLLSIAEFYLEMDSVMQENRDLIDPEYLVINKIVSVLETFNLREATFTEEEISDLRSQPWAKEVDGFISNQFAVGAYADSDRFPAFYTDLFFEAVPDKYLDIKNEAWKFIPGQRTIPVILPK